MYKCDSGIHFHRVHTVFYTKVNAAVHSYTGEEGEETEVLGGSTLFLAIFICSKDIRSPPSKGIPLSTMTKVRGADQT